MYGNPVALGANKKQKQPALHCPSFSSRKISAIKKGSSSRGFSSKQNSSTTSIVPRILVVDDNRINRLVFQTFLTQMGFDVECAVDGESALAKDIENYTVILLDIGLPDRSGIEVCQKIRAKETSKKKIPIFFLTSFDIAQKKKECLAAGGNKVLQKPISEEQLREHLSAWLPKKLKKNK